MTVTDFEPLSIVVPLREEPSGIFRVGESRVLLEVVLRAFQRGESPEGIVRCYPSLQLRDVYAVVSRYMADPAPFDDYLRLCDEQAEALGANPRRTAAWNRQRGIAGACPCKGIGPVIPFLVDQNFNEHIVNGLTRRDAGLRFTLGGMSACRRSPIRFCWHGRPSMAWSC